MITPAGYKYRHHTDVFKCVQPCKKSCSEGHPCQKPCYERCYPCWYKEAAILDCGHQGMRSCPTGLATNQCFFCSLCLEKKPFIFLEPTVLCCSSRQFVPGHRGILKTVERHRCIKVQSFQQTQSSVCRSKTELTLLLDSQLMFFTAFGREKQLTKEHCSFFCFSLW